MKIKRIFNKCLGLAFLFVIYSEQAYSMSWLLGGPVEQPKKMWVKRAHVQAEQQATADVLDQLLQEDNYPEVTQLFSTFMQQHDEQSQYALRWAKDAANRGVFPVQYELIKYYHNRFYENVAGLSTQEVEYLCELMMKGEFLVRMSYKWFCFKCDYAMTKQVLDVWRFVSGQYHQFLITLLGKYEPDYELIYANVQSWLTGQYDTLKVISPLWLTTGTIRDGQLVFGVPEEAVLGSLYGMHGVDGLHKQNEEFLTTHNKVHKTGHFDHESWKNFCAYLKNIAESKKSN
ncbi:hypothetical protein JST56_02345 [Candidatus Dependentiae bacterium]|jgi:hypothetical protein|nr:hypothetical protein [Candidatus Dependentiae bacterium]